MMSQFERVASVSEIPAEGRLSVIVEDRVVLLVRQGDEILAIEDLCTHDGQPLTQGVVEKGAIACPRHGAQFDLRSGKALCMPATEGVSTFAVRVENGEILVSTEPSPPQGNSISTEVAPAATDLPTPTSAASPAPAESTATGVAPNESEMIEALKQVIDPELMINIVDLGLIYNVNLQGEIVDVDMTLTSPACPAGPQIMQQSKMALEKLPGIGTANIKLVMTPPWSPDRMTDEARDQLGIF